MAAGRPFDQAATQLAFAISAMHTTSELLKQVLVDICTNSHLIQPLRDELETAVNKSGWMTAAMFKMQLVDSVIKETQRLKLGSLVNLERKVLRDVLTPDGTALPKCTNLAMDTANMWAHGIFENPETYDGHRFFNIRRSQHPKSSPAQLVSPDPDFIAFGLGTSICPGRFMVANVIKVALATILIRYDVKLPAASNPKVMHYGFEMLAGPTTTLEVRRRKV